MKRLVIFGMAVLLAVAGYAENPRLPEAIEYAINDDFQSFKAYVDNGGDLSIKTEKGLSIVEATGYFSENNFKKACDLLSSKKVNLDSVTEDNMSLLHYLCYSGNYEKTAYLMKFKPEVNRKSKALELSPAQMTQYATFKYYENQPDSSANVENSKKIRKLLLKNKDKNFTYSEVTYSHYGNLLLLLVNTAAAFYPMLPGKMFFSSDLAEPTENNGQQMATVTKERMKAYFDKWYFNPEITEYNNPQEIKDVIKESINSEDSYILFAQTGNNPLAPFQWITINGFTDSNIDSTSFLLYSTADSNFNMMEYQLKDISYLIALKIHM